METALRTRADVPLRSPFKHSMIASMEDTSLMYALVSVGSQTIGMTKENVWVNILIGTRKVLTFVCNKLFGFL